MSLLRPKAPQMAPPPPPPVIEDADARGQEQADMLRRRRGRASAILTERGGPMAQTASKTLLGS